eukprot:scpid90065/ scgid22621/ 
MEEGPMHRREKHTDFLRSVYNSLLGEGKRQLAAQAHQNPSTPVPAHYALAQHQPEKIPGTPCRSNSQKECCVCAKSGPGRDARFQCPACPGKPVLRIVRCFVRHYRL